MSDGILSTLQMVNGFLLYTKLFKYMRFSKRVRFLFAMFEKSAADLLIFGIAMLVFLLTFALPGFLLFCSDVNDFRDFGKSFTNLIRFTVSEFGVFLGGVFCQT